MPIQTRCPSCAAAVLPTAAWCSLCHADLRPRPASPVSSTSVTVVPDTSIGPDLVDSTVSGRHSAGGPGEAPRSTGSTGSGGGRHAARGPASRGGRPAPRTAPRPAALAPLDDLELPSDGEVSPEKVDELAEQMLARLAVSETGADVLDPESLPGGKWGFAAGVMAALVLAFIVVSWILVRLTTH